MPAARHVDEIGALGQRGESLGAEKSARVARERQHIDQDVGARQEIRKTVAAVERLDARQDLGRAAPAGGRKAESGKLPGRVLSNRTQTHDADAAMDSVDEVEWLPRLGTLACGILVD